jgi:hypothetical protein
VRTRVATLAGPLCLAALLLGACGGGSGSGGRAENHPAPPVADFPAPKGASLDKTLRQANGHSDLVLTGQTTVLYPGPNRYVFGVFTRSVKDQVTDAQVALYVAKQPPKSELPTPKANGTPATKKGRFGRLSKSLSNPAYGPYPAKIESLATKPAFQSKSTADDPDAAKVLYTTSIDFPGKGQWRIGALIKNGDQLSARLMTPVKVGQINDIPRVGQRPPDIHTPTRQSVGGDLARLTTRVPPESMNKTDFHDVLGKKPIVLLFATPKFCQSRVCGPVVDEASQVQRQYGNQAEFIHMEIYKDNDPAKGVRPQVRAFHLPSEPWLFVIDRRGIIRTAIEGAFSTQELTQAVKGVTAG